RWIAIEVADDGVAIGAVARIARDALGRLWFCASAAPSATAGAFVLADGRLALHAPLAARAPDVAVHDVLRDATGALWFATARGVERASDGGAWTTFRLAPDDPLPGPALRLVADWDGRVWLVT